MSEFAVVRAAHLLLYVDVLRDVGVPVDRLLDQSRLPPGIAEMPDAYVSVDLAMDWVGRSSRDAQPMELGFLAAGRSALETLSERFRSALLAAPTGFTLLETFLRLALVENSAVHPRLRQEGACIRAICDIDGFARHPDLGFGECLNLQATISAVRSVAGPTWCPRQMTFVTRGDVPDGLQAAMPDTRILFGQPHTSILFAPDELGPGLARGVLPSAAEPSQCVAGDHDGWTLISAMRSAIRPYVGHMHPTLPLAAEIMGTSVRSLQRRLRKSGYTYSQLVQEVRFQIARDLLAEPSVKIIDVAMMTGYDSPQHFSRAFRRLSGMTPTMYRSAFVEAG